MLTITTATGTIEIPRPIEAQGGAAIDAYVNATPRQRAQLLKAATPDADAEAAPTAPAATSDHEEPAR